MMPPLAALAMFGSSDAVTLPITLLLVFGVAKLFGEIFERFGQPGIAGEILAGVVLGPGVLRLVEPDAVLKALAEMGVMFLLFRVGLEVKASELMKVGRTALLVALCGVVLPFVMGVSILAATGASRIESVFVGAALVATSVGITARVLAQKGLLAHPTSQIILAAAVIDDVLGLLVLAVVSSIAQGSAQVGGLVVTGLVAGGFTLLVARYGTPAMRRILPHVEQRLSAAEAQFNLSLVLLFALSVAAVYVGVAAIIGAFLAGMALSETVNRRVHDLAQGITELLVPFFLASIGLNLDLSVFGSVATIWLTVAIVLAAVVSKLVGCAMGAWGLTAADRLRVGVGMIPRGEVGMVVAQIGLGLGVIPKAVYGVTVFMAVATTIIAPPLLGLVYRGVKAEAAGEEFSIG